MYTKKEGLTTIELVVAITIGALVLVALLPILLSLFSNQYRQLIKARQISEIHKAVIMLNTDLSRALTYLRSPEVSDSSFPSPGSGWHFSGSGPNQRTLILQMAATTLPLQNNNRKLLQLGDNRDGCARGIVDTMTYSVVYYVKDSNLYRRTLMPTLPTDKIVCDDEAPHQKTTSFPGSTDSKPKDILVLKDIRTFGVNYYKEGTTQPSTDAYSPASTNMAQKETPLDFKRLSIDLESVKMIDNNTQTYSAKLQGSLL